MAAFLDHRVNHRVISSWRGLVQGSGVPTGSNSGKHVSLAGYNFTRLRVEYDGSSSNMVCSTHT